MTAVACLCTLVLLVSDFLILTFEYLFYLSLQNYNLPRTFGIGIQQVWLRFKRVLVRTSCLSIGKSALLL